MNPTHSLSEVLKNTGVFFLVLFTTLPGFNVASAQEMDLKTNQSSQKGETKYVRIIYLIPADSIEKPEYTLGLENAARHLQMWYYNELGQNKTFTLHNPVVEVYHTSHEALWYSTYPNGSDYFWNNVLQEGYQLTGGYYGDPDNIWVFYIDANNGCDQCGGCGWAGRVVIAANDLKGLVGYEIDKSCPNVIHSYKSCRYVGGLGHELGHALGLHHPPECDEDFPTCWDHDLMMYGYVTYPDAYFNESDKTRLSNNPFIRNIDIEGLYYPTSCMKLNDTCNFSTQSEISITYGDSILLEDKYQKTPGIYYDTLHSAANCDTIIITYLNVIIPPVDAEDVSICEGEVPVLTAEGENIRWYSAITNPVTDLHDSRDGQNYNTVVIGNQIWMAENLNYYTSSGSWYYDYDSVSYSETYGRLYNWETAQNICPLDWHLPDDNDWLELIDYLGGDELAGGRIKEPGYDHWDPPNTGASNMSGFTALPAGKKDFEGDFYHLGYYSKFWSASEYNSDWGKTFEVRSNSAETFTGSANKKTAFGIRCTRDYLLVGNGNSFTSNYELPGVYTYYVTQTIFEIESPVDTVVLTINKIPSEPTRIRFSICEGDSILTGDSYYTSTGTHYDTLQTIHGCDSVVITELTVNPLPIIDLGNDTIISTNDTIVLDAGNNFLNYSWSDGSSEQTITLHNLNIGDYEYSVSVTNINNCINSDTVVIHVILPSTSLISSILTDINLEIFPNPTSDFLYIKSTSNIKTEFTLTLIDISGKAVYKISIEKLDADNQIKLNLLNLKTGFYILRINNNSLIEIEKMVKK